MLLVFGVKLLQRLCLDVNKSEMQMHCLLRVNEAVVPVATYLVYAQTCIVQSVETTLNIFVITCSTDTKAVCVCVSLCVYCAVGLIVLFVTAR